MVEARVGILVMLLLMAVWGDIQSHRIPNLLILIGVVFGVLSGLWITGLAGMVSAVQGFLLGLALFLPLYLLKTMGAGDVKLMAMAGTFLGPGGVFGAVIGTFLAGGVLAILIAARNRVLMQLLENLKLMLLGGMVNASLGKALVIEGVPNSVGKLPYAVAIAIGIVGWLFWNQIINK